MKDSLRLLTVAFVLLALAGVAWSGELIVDQKHPDAADSNPGTLAKPFKTVQAAMDKAQPGDTVQVRAGVYNESVTFPRSGNANGAAWDDLQNVQWITLEAYKDEHAMLDGSVTVPAKDWKLVEGRKNTYVTGLEGRGGPEPWRKTITMVFANDVMFTPSLVAHHDVTQPGLPMIPGMPGDKTSDEGWFYDKDQKKLFVNLGGRAPGLPANKSGEKMAGNGVEIAAAVCDMGVNAMERSYVRLRKMEVRRYNFRGVWTDRSNDFQMEDCYVHHCLTAVWGGTTSGQTIRGNIMSDTISMGMYVHNSRGVTIENNIIKRCHVNPFKTEGSLSSDYYSGTIMCNAAFGLLIRNNIITESDVSGPWPDCGSTGIVIYGNTLYGLGGDGFYIEDAVHGTVLKWNTVFNNGSGIMFRQNFANTAFENYVFNNRRSGLGIGSCDAMGIKSDNMVYNWVIGNGVGVAFGPDKSGESAHAFDHNIYSGNGTLFQFGDKQFKDIKAVRDGIGEELHGQEVKDFDPATLGLVTFRVHDTKESWKPVPMFGNPVATRSDVQSPYAELYLWKKGTFLRPEYTAWNSGGFGGIGGFTRGEGTGFMRVLPAWIIPFQAARADAKVDKGADDPSAIWKNPSVPWGNNACLQVCAAPGKAVSAEGLGYWSAKLPTTDGAIIDLSLWMRAKGLKPAGENGGAYAFAEFTDETGQNATRQYLVGANDGQKVAGEKLASGTYEYTKASGAVTAPKGARWFRMGFGARNCTGWVAFNNFDIQTRPGEKPAEANVVLPIIAKQYKWTVCDLTGLLNRPLADEVDNDGKGGWTDQGPTMDLRNLYAGDYTYNNVAFRVAKGNACFIMKNKQRPSEGLPASGKVDLKGKADVLAFLHTGGWIQPGTREATYVIHYEDGQKVEIPVIGGKNIFDWVASPTVLENVKYNPELGFTQCATKVVVPRFVSAYVWMTLWKNPRPDKAIVALEVKGGNEDIPGLIAVSRGVAK